MRTVGKEVARNNKRDAKRGKWFKTPRHAGGICAIQEGGVEKEGNPGPVRTKSIEALMAGIMQARLNGSSGWKGVIQRGGGGEKTKKSKSKKTPFTTGKLGKKIKKLYGPAVMAQGGSTGKKRERGKKNNEERRVRSFFFKVFNQGGGQDRRTSGSVKKKG